MTSCPPGPLAAALVAALVAAPVAAGAADVQVDPVLVELSPAARSGALTLRNAGAEPARFQLVVRAWHQLASGEMHLEPTDDVLVYPPAMTLAPGEARLVRVGLAPKAGFGALEQGYRLMIEEQPPPEKPGQPSQVQLLSRLSLPVFLAPGRPVERPALAAPVVSGGEARFALRNEGTLRFKASGVVVETRAAGGAVLGRLELPAWYVLAGGERAYRAALPQARCAEARAVEVTAALEKQTLHASAPTPDGVCAPP